MLIKFQDNGKTAQLKLDGFTKDQEQVITKSLIDFISVEAKTIGTNKPDEDFLKTFLAKK